MEFVTLNNGVNMPAIAALETGTSRFFSHRAPSIVKWMSERRLDI